MAVASSGLRGPKNSLDPAKPYGFFHEWEMGAEGALEPVNVLLLTNRECPFRCIFCDLWKNTLDRRVDPGAIPGQIRYALERLPPAPTIKLYNSGSFFDPNAVPPEDDEAICRMLAGFRRVIVECHPAFVGRRCFRFARRLDGQLEVAMGLETANPQVLARLKKGMTRESFRVAAEALASNGIDMRAFVILGLPYQPRSESVDWAVRSVEFAFDCGAHACSLIPARGGTPELEAARRQGEFCEPSLPELERAAELAVSLGRGRVFADLWDVERLFTCVCSPARSRRLQVLNSTQRIPPPVSCNECGE